MAVKLMLAVFLLVPLVLGLRAPCDVAEAQARAFNWLLTQRNADWTWGWSGERVMLALQMTDHSWMDESPTTQLTLKQVSLDLLRQLHDSRVPQMGPGELAYAIHALHFTCQDPRSFYGYDLVQRLDLQIKMTVHVPNVLFNNHFEYALATLALCNSDVQVKENQVRLLLSGLRQDGSHRYGPDEASLALMAISCLVQKDQPLWNLDLDFEERVNHLAAHQLSDMTFGNAHTTALAIQALQAAQRVVTQIWPPVHVGRTQFDRVHGATSALCAMAENDGSYGHSVFTTAEVLPALRWRTYIRDDALCRVTSPEPINTNGMYNVWQTNPKYITVDMLVKNAIDVNTYYNERLESVTANSSLHKILTEVQEMDPNFSFETEQTELGNMLTSLFNVDASLRDNSFWAVYRSAPGGDEYAVHVGIDEFVPQDGDTIVLKYRRADGDAQF